MDYVRECMRRTRAESKRHVMKMNLVALAAESPGAVVVMAGHDDEMLEFAKSLGLDAKRPDPNPSSVVFRSIETT